ncbi:hypothetical protein M408DRAFT_24545 [Serendipita vermifera MAFF 305830]|uniref:Uncharacterized protein n=1 Tax=Serendipita vermifera MAFF 305830 TaxID=933852 RepID=A0A0C3B557_SERVB|nr:hypothetical protein M408DRAFT_24545 [Serendipita vermifera MAFF 305830]
MIPQDSGHPFAGRYVGSGDRSTIYGSRLYGSGYPSSYTDNGGDAVQGRGFPYGSWPISWGAYRGGEEYTSSTLDVLRPGGPLVTVSVTPNPSTNEVYQLVGDRDSVMFMISDLVDWCHATPQWPQIFSASGNATRPENVIQYYRASSFALTFAGYNNTAALGAASSTASVPLPDSIVNSPFLACINDTIAVALPILDWPRDAKGLSAGAIVGIVFGAIAGATILFVLGLWAYEKFKSWYIDRV